MRLFVGLDRPGDTRHFEASFVSVNALRRRKAAMPVRDWILDSGAFTTIAKHGRYLEPPEVYAEQIKRWRSNGNLLAAVTQDFMCEAHILERTGLTVAEHQRLTIERYDSLIRADTGVYIMPVLQGYDPGDYVAHIRAYGARLAPGAWVGVGSICKRNRNPRAIEEVLHTIAAERPDLRLHGFGVKATALRSPLVSALLHSADSMAWSYAARRQRRNGHDWREARAWAARIEERPIQSTWTFSE